MLVSITRNGAQAHTWFPATVTWTAKASRSMGSASFFIHRTSPVWQSGVLHRKGAQMITITDGRRVWVGVADVPAWQEDGAQVTGLEVGEWMRTQVVKRHHSFRARTAGAIVRACAIDALQGIAWPPVIIGPIVQAAPLIHAYDVDPGTELESVLTAMMDESGQEWAIDHDTLTFRWQMSTGRYREGLLVDDGQLLSQIRPGSIRDMYQEVMEYDDRTRRTFTAWDGSAPLTWPAQKGINV